MKTLSPFYCFCFLLTVLVSQSFGQNAFAPEKLGAAVNSEEYAEINPVLSPDGKTLYFVRINHPENNYGTEGSQDIWFATMNADGSWSEAQHMPYPFNTARYNSVYSISEDGSKVLINGIYNKNGKWIRRGLSYAERTGDGWSVPQRVKVPAFSRKNKGVSSNAFLSSDGQALLLSFTKKFNGKKLNLYVSRKKNGKWTKPKKLYKPVSLPRRSEEAPFLSEDGKTLYFSGNRGEDKKDFNIYSCSRLDDSYRKWSEPVLLGDTINSRGWESYLKTNRKGSYAYYTSVADVSGEADIFRVKLFEENPFVVIQGSVVNSKTGQALPADYTYTLYVNDVKADSFRIDPATGMYRIKLPLGKNYVLKAVAENFTPQAEEVNVTGVKEYTEMHKDLRVVPLPYVLLEGDLLVMDDKTVVPDTSLPKVFVDGLVADSALTGAEKGRYRLKLPYGKKYVIEVKAHGFKSISQPADFASVKEFKKVEKPLYVERIKIQESGMITVYGKVINVKGNKPVDPALQFEVRVNDVPVAAVINRETSEYKLTLSQGASYSINAYAPGYYPVYENVDLTQEKNKQVARDLHIAPIEVGQSVKLNNILFETGKAALKKTSHTELDKVITFLKDNPTIKIEIHGHTDNVGNSDANLKLSRDRAASVATYIIHNGVDKDRISSKGFGATKPVASNKTARGKALNRRVEFTILEK